MLHNILQTQGQGYEDIDFQIESEENENRMLVRADGEDRMLVRADGVCVCGGGGGGGGAQSRKMLTNDT